MVNLIFKNFKWASLTLLFITTSCGTGSEEELYTPLANASSVYSNEVSDIDYSDDSFVLKFNAYIDISNYIEGGLLYASVTNFLNLITEEGTIDPSSASYEMMSNMFHEGQISFHRNRVEAARNFQVLEPSFGALDLYIIPVLDYLDRLHDLMFIEIRDYFYINRTWENGNSNGGILLRERLLSYEDAVFDIFESFAISFSEFSLSQIGADLPFFEEDGLYIHFYALSIALEFISIGNYLGNLEAVENDIDNLRDRYNSLSNYIYRFSQIYFDEESQRFEGFSDFAINHGLPNLVNSSELGLSMLSNIIDQVENGTPLTDASIDGFFQMIDHIITSYNNLIN